MEDMFFTAEITACDSEEYEEIIRSRLEKEGKNRTTKYHRF